jgi:hypothetical protein
MALGRRKTDTESFISAESKLLAMAYNTSGWIVAASTNRTALRFRRPSTLCSAGITMRQGAMYI